MYSQIHLPEIDLDWSKLIILFKGFLILLAIHSDQFFFNFLSRVIGLQFAMLKKLLPSFGVHVIIPVSVLVIVHQFQSNVIRCFVNTFSRIL